MQPEVALVISFGLQKKPEIAVIAEESSSRLSPAKPEENASANHVSKVCERGWSMCRKVGSELLIKVEMRAVKCARFFSLH